MATNYLVMGCTPEDVFRVLADGWLYPTWVVGASRMRDVEAAWPNVGARLHHSFGVWPALINDSTVVREWDPPRHVRLTARGWPTGEAEVVIDVKPRKAGCIVRISEDAVAGPAMLIPRFLRAPAMRYRNSETLRRLAFLAEGGAGT